MTIYRNVKINRIRLYNKMAANCKLDCKYKMNENDEAIRVKGEGSFPIGKSRILNLTGLGIPEGALVTAHVDVVAGKDNEGPAWFVYSKNSQTIASYTITGTTLHNGVICRPNGYCHNDTIDCSNPSWMGRLPDNMRISQISMVGTHDTAAFYGGDSLECQSLSLKTQLEAGIRALDIRCKNKEEDGKKVLKIYHRNQYEKLKLEDVLNTIIEFFRKHPTETILMRVSNEAQEDESEKEQEAFDDLFYNNYWTQYKKYF